MSVQSGETLYSQLHDSLAAANADERILTRVKEGEPVPFLPSPVLEAVFQAGNIMRHAPATRLAETVLDADETLLRDSSSRALVSMVNGSIERVEDNPLAFRCMSAKALAVCVRAETGHVRLLQALEGKDTESSKQWDYHLQVIAEDGEPVILRKFLQASPSALTLKEVTIDGVPYPPGSLCRLGFKTGLRPDKRKAAIDASGDKKIDIYAPCDVESLGFIRLSAYALSLGERAAIRWPSEEWQSRGVERLDQIVRLAREVVAAAVPRG